MADIYNEVSNTLVAGTAYNDSITNYGEYVTINSGDGNDSIYHGGGDSVSIDAGNGNDSIFNRSDGDYVTINGGKGNDILDSAGKNVLFQYMSGDGNDFILGFDSDDTLKIDGGTGTYSTTKSGDNLFVCVGNDTITLVGAASLTGNILGNRKAYTPVTPDTKLIRLTENADTYFTSIEGATIQALAGGDSLFNVFMNTSINAGTGNDSILNYGDSLTIDGGDGDDYIRNSHVNDRILGDYIISGNNTIGSNNSTINGGAGNDIIENSGDSVTIDGGVGDDSITNKYFVNGSILGGDNVSMVGGTGNDSITNCGDSVTIDGGDGNDTIDNGGDYYIPDGDTWIPGRSSNNSSINGGAGDDSILSTGDSVTIDGGVGNDYINNYGVYTLIEGNDGNDSIVNHTAAYLHWDADYSTVSGGAGDDSIQNFNGDFVSIDGGDDNDNILNGGVNVTIDGGTGNDSIGTFGTDVAVDGGAGDDFIINAFVSYNYAVLFAGSSNVTMNGGDGNDSIANNHGDSVSINGGDGNDEIGTSGNNSTVDGGADNDTITNYGDSVSIDGGDGNDSINNLAILNWNAELQNYEYALPGNVTVNGGADNDTITNHGDSVSIDGGAGNDYILNSHVNDTIASNITGSKYAISIGNDTIGGNNSTIDGGAGDDSIFSSGDSVTIDGGDGNDTITNEYFNFDGSLVGGDNVSMVGGAGNDSITNRGDSVTIDGGAGDDYINNYFDDNVTIDGGDGNDYIYDVSSTVTINSGAGNDTIYHSGYDAKIDGGTGNDLILNLGNYARSTVDGGEGNDRIGNSAFNVSLNGGAGNDSIENYGDSVTIDGGDGNDRISLVASVSGNVISYTLGDGNDTVWGYSDDAALLQINSSVGWSSIVSGDNVIITVGDGSITLVDAAPADTTPADTTPTIIPADTTPADTTPADTTPADTTPADTTPADTTPADTTPTIIPADTTPADTTPADTTPADTTPTIIPADTTPADTTPSGIPVDTTPADTTPTIIPADTTPTIQPDPTPVTVTPETVTPESLPPAVSGAAYDIVFVLDVSGSMATYITRVNEIAQTFTDKLAERGITDYRLGVIEYETNSVIYPLGADGTFFTTDVEMFKSAMSLAASRVDGGTENGLTALNDAMLNYSWQFRPEANKEFIMLTDEDFDDGAILNVSDVEQLLTTNGVQLDVIGAVDGSCDSAWTPVARSTGGNFYDISGDYEEIFSDIVLNLDCVNVNLATVPDGQIGYFLLVPGNHVTDLKSVDAVFVSVFDPNLEAYAQTFEVVGTVTADKVYNAASSRYRQNVTIPDLWNVTATSHADILDVAGTGFGVVIASGDGHDAVNLGEFATGIILTDHSLNEDGLSFATKQVKGTFTESVETNPYTLMNQVTLASPTMAIYLQNFSSPVLEEFTSTHEKFLAYSVTNGNSSDTVYELLFGQPDPIEVPETPDAPAPPIFGDQNLSGRIMFAQWGYGFTPPEGNPLFTDTSLVTSADLAADFGSPTLDDISPANFAATTNDIFTQNFNALNQKGTETILASNKLKF